MTQKMNATLPHRSNAPVTPFAEEPKKVTKKVRQQVDEAALAELEAKQAEQAGEEQAPKAQTAAHVRQLERQALADAGLKRCTYHQKYFDRLPDVARIPFNGHPVEIRRLDEFGKSSSSSDGKQAFCKACDHLAMRDAREKAKSSDPHAGQTSIVRLDALIARKTAQYNALAREIDELNVQLSAMRSQQAAERDTNASNDPHA
jgi:hypothetical protein